LPEDHSGRRSSSDLFTRHVRQPNPLLGLPGTIADATGNVGAGQPDIVCAGVEYTNTILTLRLAFVPTTFDPATTSITFFLDTDPNPLTGSPGVNGTGTLDGSLIGSEFIISFGSAYYGGNATVQATTSGFPVAGFPRHLLRRRPAHHHSVNSAR
jgi:hypothetical protein